jgi:uncharacterized protein
MTEFKRSIQPIIENQLYKGKVIILYGARRTGKTFLCNQIISSQETKGVKTKYLSCETFSIKQKLQSTNELELKNYLQDSNLIILDEAQNVENIGLTLKLLVDFYPEIQVIATGSSSFDLANKTGEPLTGRARRFTLAPLSIEELKTQYDQFMIDSYFEKTLIYGLYPSVFNASNVDARLELDEIASNYLYKDVLEHEQVKNSTVLLELLQLLALQLGNEVSYYELGQKLALDSATVKRYIDLLTKSFVIFPLKAFSRNLRKEIGKAQKIYFYDLGIRNSLIQNYNFLKLRNDVGALWENFCIIERLKYNQAHLRFVNPYFWRTYDQKEIDYIEEHSGQLDGYEFKWNKENRFKPPKSFIDTYENATVKKIDPSNYLEFITRPC